jgi:hypothetical protein
VSRVGVLRHGTWSGYKTYNCRCEQCVEAGLGGNARRYQQHKEWLAQVKDKPCADCGGRFPTVCMEFDHRDPAEKSFGISESALRARASLEAEIAKCDVVCSNCHRIRTAVQVAAKTVKPGRPRKSV